MIRYALNGMDRIKGNEVLYLELGKQLLTYFLMSRKAWLLY